jgi:hypothetical protein
MSIELVHCRYNLGNELHLDAYAIDPSLTSEILENFLREKENSSNFNLANLSREMCFKGEIESLRDIKVKVINETYEIPKQLKPYREALESKLIAQGKKNGPIAVLNGELGKEITLRRGGYFDFMATKLEEVPARLLPKEYPAEATVEQLMKEYGINNEQRARYLAFAYLMLPQDGSEFQLVQRAKGMGIAPDCVSTSGSTPPFSNDFFDEKFDFSRFWENHVAQEMGEEYKMEAKEFTINGGYILDDKMTLPHLVLKIKASPSTAKLAERIYGDKEAINEHPILYSMPRRSIQNFLKRFEVWPMAAFASNRFSQEK